MLTLNGPLSRTLAGTYVFGLCFSKLWNLKLLWHDNIPDSFIFKTIFSLKAATTDQDFNSEHWSFQIWLAHATVSLHPKDFECGFHLQRTEMSLVSNMLDYSFWKSTRTFPGFLLPPLPKGSSRSVFLISRHGSLCAQVVTGLPYTVIRFFFFITIMMTTLSTKDRYFLECLCEAWLTDKLSLGPSLLSVALITRCPTYLGEGRVYLPYASWYSPSLMEVSPSLMKRNASYWLALPGLLSPLSYIFQDTCVGVSLLIIAWVLPHPSSIRKCLTDMPTGQPDGSKFSFEIPSSQGCQID